MQLPSLSIDRCGRHRLLVAGRLRSIHQYEKTGDWIHDTLPSQDVRLLVHTHDDMEVEVVDRLAAVGPVIHDHPEPFVEPLV